MDENNPHGETRRETIPQRYHDQEEDGHIPNGTAHGEAADDVLPFEAMLLGDGKLARHWPLRIARITRMALACLTIVAYAIAAIFLATCPKTRQWMAYPFRQILTIVFICLMIIPPYAHNARADQFGPSARAKRLLISYAALVLALYALIFTSDDVHIWFHWNTLIWYSTLEGPQLGYFSRTVLTVIAFFIHRHARLHSVPQIVATYFFSILAVYVDCPMTLIDLGRGRPQW